MNVSCQYVVEIFQSLIICKILEGKEQHLLNLHLKMRRFFKKSRSFY